MSKLRQIERRLKRFNELRRQRVRRRQRRGPRTAGLWTRFWTHYGGWMLLTASMLGVCTALLVIYSKLENLGWFNL